jgi:exosortase A-associated hydrolase 1
MVYTEKAVTFECESDVLFGILTVPSAPVSTAVLVIVGGPQYRVGSHRQFVQLARSLATSGFSVLRFDVRGMGDSEGVKKDFEHVSNDIKAAKEYLTQTSTKIKSIFLWGLCDGASAALLYHHRYKDPQVKGLCLVNPWIRSDKSYAFNTLKYYYLNRLIQAEFWKKFFNGGITWQAGIDFFKKLELIVTPKLIEFFKKKSTYINKEHSKKYQDRMQEAALSFEGKILILLSQKDFIAKEFIDHLASASDWPIKDSSKYSLFEVAGADHTLTQASARHLVEQKTINWMKSF